VGNTVPSLEGNLLEGVTTRTYLLSPFKKGYGDEVRRFTVKFRIPKRHISMINNYINKIIHKNKDRR